MAADADARFFAAVEKLQMVCETSGKLRKDLKQSIFEAIAELHAVKDEYKVTIRSLNEQLKKYEVSLSAGTTTVGTFAEVAAFAMPRSGGTLPGKQQTTPMFTAVVKSMNGRTSEDLRASLKDFELEMVTKNVREEDPISTMKKIASSDSPYQKKIGSALMEETYSKRRHFIFVESPLVSLIKKEYPLLFSTNEIKKEFDRTFHVGMCDAFIEQIDKYSNAILTLCDPSNPIYQRTMKSIKYCHTEQQKKYAEAVGSILVLPSLVDETIDFVYTSDNSKENAIYPYIDAHLHSLKELFFDNMPFKIVTEKQLVCEATSFKEAVLCLLACYFIFNINYMESCEDTLVVFEKLYLRANHTSDISEKAEHVIKMVRVRTGS